MIGRRAWRECWIIHCADFSLQHCLGESGSGWSEYPSCLGMYYTSGRYYLEHPIGLWCFAAHPQRICRQQPGVELPCSSPQYSSLASFNDTCGCLRSVDTNVILQSVTAITPSLLYPDDPSLHFPLYGPSGILPDLPSNLLSCTCTFHCGYFS